MAESGAPQEFGPVQLTRRLDLDVLAQPAQADLFGTQDLGADERIARIRIEPLRVERLVERELQIDRLVVEGDIAVIGPGKRGDRYLPHAEVALDPVAAHARLYLVQERILERPEMDAGD